MTFARSAPGASRRRNARATAMLALSALAAQIPGAAAQEVSKARAIDPLAPTRQAVALAERGACAEALPALKRSKPPIAEKALRYRALAALARCAMSVGDVAVVAEALALLRRDFPDDPEVLYLSARYFSQIANRAAQELARNFPNSAQVAKMNAEALESRRMWDEAIQAYRKILAEHPATPDLHFRIARILLDNSPGTNVAAEAKRELELELKVNPNSAGAEFVLGEIARRAGDWSTAITHFSRATRLDVGFLEAYLALGMSHGAAGDYASAIPPLERYAKNVPADPAGHYQLAMAYARTGNKAAADRQLQLHREALARAATRRPPNSPPP